jgi:hypothetical protein
MTLETFARRLAGSLSFSGFGLLIAAAVCWSTVGDGDPVVHSIHTVGGSALAAFGAVLMTVGLTLAAGVPAAHEDPRTRTHRSDPPDGERETD